MKAGGPQSAPRALVEVPGYRIVETVHASGPRVILRARRAADGAEVILKTLSESYPRKRRVAELRREFALSSRLSVDGVIRVTALVEYGHGSVAIEMEPFGVSLADHLLSRGGKPLGIDAFLALGIELARILSRVHERGVVHKDIAPRNVLIDPSTSGLRLIDFGISSELSRERQDATISNRLEGSLPYISPEQTGRMNRDVDYRSDYYSLGCTFYELLTGKLPFEAEGALEWVHRHIGSPVPSARDADPRVPRMLACVVEKLMAKNAEDRYQSAYGLIRDLERCAVALPAEGSVPPFDLGAADLSREFRIPQKLYGREEELERLGAIFDDVAHGGTELCLISGYSGVGKSALAKELSRSIVRERGYLIEGKFDQFQQSRAYGAFATAFADLARQLLGEPKERLDMWRGELELALGKSGGLITALIPEFELILGEQPPIPELPPTEAQKRFQLVFASFVQVFAAEGHPLVIFIDDLQWSDVPTLNLLSRLMASRELHHVLVIGAFRSNQVEATHPLRVTLDEIAKDRELVELPLSPLSLGAVECLAADALHTEVDRARPLSELLYQKSHGNPFFVNELLKGLHGEGAIAFDAEEGRWRWDLSLMSDAEFGDNVVDFLVASLRRLSDETQQVLALAACIGNRFDLRTLSIIHERSPAATGEALGEALRRQLLVPLSASYVLVGHHASESETEQERLNPVYKFQHDRVQQAAYALIDDAAKQSTHLSIGRLVRDHSSEDEREERLIEVALHLNIGRPGITDRAERHALAELNLRAGRKAQRSSAYGSALRFLEVARELLPEDAWSSCYELNRAISSEYQQCAYLTADFEAADAWTETLLAELKTPLERAEVLSARTRQYATSGRMSESIDAAIEGLAMLGYEVKSEPDAADVEREKEAVPQNLGGRSVASLVDADEIEDPRDRVAIRLLMEIFPAAFLSGSGDLFPYLVLKMVNLSLATGSSPESAFAYAAYGMLLCGGLEDPAAGFEYGKLGVLMNERFDDLTLKSRILYVYAMFVHHWSNHWSTMTPWFQRGIEAGYQSGDMLYLAYSAQDCIIWDPKLDLETAAEEQRKYLRIVQDCEYRDSYDSGSLFLQMQRNLLGKTDGLYSLGDDDFDEAEVVRGMRDRGFMTGIANFHIYKAEIHHFYGDAEGAMEHVLAQDELLASAMSLPQLVRFYIVSFLARAALHDGLNAEEKARVRTRLEDDLATMARWSTNCPENFEHLAEMMRGELARLDFRLEVALGHFERAAELARESEFRRDEAMANELAAKALLGAGLAKAAEGYLRSASYLYYRWGAQRKVDQLAAEHPQLLAPAVASDPSGTSEHTLRTQTGSLDPDALDMSSVMKASHAISGEIHLQKLWRTTMAILLENAGGQVGHFVTRRDGALSVVATSEVGADRRVRESVPPQALDGTPELPLSVINNVLRTGEPLVLHDATEASRFANDPYFVARRPRSVLCIPLRRHAKFEGAIYMENNLTPGAFTNERVEVMKLLSAQASISMENAGLYEEQLRLTEAQRRFVPRQFIEILGHHDIAGVDLGEYVARDMSVMFADLRQFTPLAERLGPRAMIELLNRYFSHLADPIAEAGGFIDSYNGDEVMALFGGTGDRAVEAGVGMRRALYRFNRESQAEGGPTLEMGIGLNSGPLVLGTVGSRERLKCGVVGDTVNLASRIEQLTKTYGAPFLIGEHTHDALERRERFSLRRVDRVAVKGKAEAVTLYEVLDAERRERRERKESTRGLLEQARAHYLEGEFERAREIFEEGERSDPDDALFSLFVSRCRRHIETPPSGEWAGFDVLDHK